MALLREYTLGDRPIQIELLSDPDEGKAAGFPFVTFFALIHYIFIINSLHKDSLQLTMKIQISMLEYQYSQYTGTMMIHRGRVPYVLPLSNNNTQHLIVIN